MNDKKILIVDFDAESLIALSNLVYEEGFQAETAADGLTAYEKFRSGNFDLVILEPMLPKLHGFELCKRIVGHPDRKVPIIIVTAIYREPSCRLESLNVHGAAAFFTKPYNKEELRSKMLQLLVEEQEHAPAKTVQFAPAKAPAAARSAVPAAPASPPPAAAAPKSPVPDLRDLLDAKPASREPKPAKPVVDIEKELQEVVSGFVGPAKKKEVKVPRMPEIKPLREETWTGKQAREVKEQGDKDIDLLLKDAIGELAPMPKKKKPEIPVPEVRIAPGTRPVAPEPAVKPAPTVEPEPKPVRPERASVAREIKQRLPFQAEKPNNIPRPGLRPNLEKGSVPFDIDRTLIEIDKIPFDAAKPSAEDKRHADTLRPHNKKQGLFEEYGEPPKKRVSFAVIGAAAGLLLVATSAAFFVLKSKKPAPSASESFSTVRSAPPVDQTARPENTKLYPDTQGAELKPEPKKVVTKKVEEPPVEIGAPIQPAFPPEGAPVHIQDQPLMNTAAPLKSETGTAVQAPPAGQAGAPPQAKSAPVSADPQKVQSPALQKAKEGALVPFDQIDTAPVLIRRVDPKYPPLALRSGVGGIISVNALISEKGDVLRTEILKGVKDGFGLEGAAEMAVRLWKFRPAQKDGVNVKVWKSFDINFVPNPKSS
jgi:TonB family protein